MDLVTLAAAIPWIGPYIPDIVAFGGVCLVLSTVMPPPGAGSNKAYAIIYQAVNWVAFNYGHAKNATAPGNAIPAAILTAAAAAEKAANKP